MVVVFRGIGKATLANVLGRKSVMWIRYPDALDAFTPIANATIKSLSIEKQQRLYDTLKHIAKDYRSAESILRKPGFGMDGPEELEMAYENIQGEAKAAIMGIKRPA